MFIQCLFDVYSSRFVSFGMDWSTLFFFFFFFLLWWEMYAIVVHFDRFLTIKHLLIVVGPSIHCWVNSIRNECCILRFLKLEEYQIEIKKEIINEKVKFPLFHLNVNGNGKRLVQIRLAHFKWTTNYMNTGFCYSTSLYSNLINIFNVMKLTW